MKTVIMMTIKYGLQFIFFFFFELTDNGQNFLAGIVQKKNKNSFTKSFGCDTTFNFTDLFYDT
jgi:hypothetical protein